MQRTYALNDEAALIICDYGRGKRPEVPFPYFSELFTGLEYVAAALMMSHGMVAQGVECVESIRRRYDGERRNPWDEAECGHHYARAMAAWAPILALSGFRYHAADKALEVVPAMKGPVRSFWSAGTGWGSLRADAAGVTVAVEEGELAVRSVKTAAGAVELKEEVRIRAGESKRFSAKS